MNKKSRLRQSEISDSKKIFERNRLDETNQKIPYFSAVLYVIGKIYYQNTVEKIAIWRIIQCIRTSEFCLTFFKKVCSVSHLGFDSDKRKPLGVFLTFKEVWLLV